LPSGKSVSSGKPEPVIVVPVAGRVPVAVGGSRVPGVVDPRPAAKHAAGAVWVTTTPSSCLHWFPTLQMVSPPLSTVCVQGDGVNRSISLLQLNAVDAPIRIQ
jgi:hypothetical protein